MREQGVCLFMSLKNALCRAIVFTIVAMGLVPTLSGQASETGSVAVTVVDPSGAAVPGAQLELKDIATNNLRRGETQNAGTYTFPTLAFGTYQLSVARQGFDTLMFSSVVVQASRITSITASLKVGGTSQTVTVAESATPLVETDSSALANTIDTKQVVNLPLNGRNIMSLAFLVPGWSSTGGAGSSTGTWNNLPGGAVVGADFDGTPGISNRFRSGGFAYGTTAVQPRIEDIAEMTIQTGQLDLGGIGTSAMKISIVGRRGTNAFHGRLYEDFRNTSLNANSWINNARGLSRSILKLNDFGGSVGGPIVKNKLFFFTTLAESIQPVTNVVNAVVLSPLAQQGIFQYKDAAGNLQSINLLTVAGAAGYPSTVNPNVATSLKQVSDVYSKGTLTSTSDPNIFNLGFQAPAKNTIYYPTARLDWTPTQKAHLFLSYGQTKTQNDLQNAPQFPGDLPQDKLTGNSSRHNNRIAGVGLDYVFKPTLINQFHGGYMYQFDSFSYDGGTDLSVLYRQNWQYGSTTLTSPYGNAYPRVPISSFYPLLNAVDNLTGQKGAHNYTLGASWFREQDHYWNGPGGEPSYTFGLDGQDPVTNVINGALASQNTTIQGNARSVYALLAARVSAVSIQVGRPLDVNTGQYKPFGAYNLDEVQHASGIWAQDRWRLRQNLTLNYGLRWDFYGDNHDVTGFYSSPATIADLWGPTPVGVINSPGTLGGPTNPTFLARNSAYNSQMMNPSPAIALAWNPSSDHGLLGKLLGHNKTVIRTGYSLRHYAEGAQNYWAFASNSGAFFFQGGSATPANGAFKAGSVTFGDPLPPYVLTPPTYSKTVPAGNLWGNTFYGINPNIQMPYVEQWNFGIQRQVGAGSVVEVRYVGNLSLHQWLGYNINELNIFENGFLKEFQNAQSNLKINQANGKGNTFANNGLAGQAPLPIFSGAFGSATSNFTNSTYITNLQNGAAGTMAQTLLNTRQFYCNLVGTANFGPCNTSTLTTSPGAGYPINFWQINPYANGNGGGVQYLDSSGHTNYHGMQVDLRQRLTHGMQFNVNYTLAKSLGIAAQNGIQGQGNNIYYTQRDFRLNYGPSLFDIRHVVHASGTYDLPFGSGRQFLNNNKTMNYIAGGWNVGTILLIQSGNPGQLSGGFSTVNNGDSGVVLNGVTVADLQNSIEVRRTGNPWVQLFDPKFIAADGSGQTAAISRANTAGVWGYRPYIYGPSWYNIDLSVNKTVPIREAMRLVVQGEFLNVTNHPTFGLGTLGITSTSFGQLASGNSFSQARRIEFRANFEF
jgi:Carboxypeptidase regulatory-like domain